MSKKNKNRIPARKNQSPQKKPSQQQVTIQQEQHFSGPIPSPADLSNYEVISPGLANRLVAMAEKQSDHRRRIELEVIRLEEKDRRRGQFLAALVVLGVVGIAGYVAISGSQLAGSIIGSARVIGLASVFIWGRNKQ